MKDVRSSLACLFVLLLSAVPAYAEGPFLGVDLGVSEATNGNYRGHVQTGATGNPYLGYMFNEYLGVQGQVHATFHPADSHSPRHIEALNNEWSTLLGGTVGPRFSVPLRDLLPSLDPLEVYVTGQGGVFTGLSGRMSQTAPGFSVGGGIDYKLTETFAVGLFGRWNRTYMSPRPKDLGPQQDPDERFGEDARWATAGIGLKYSFPEAPPPPPAPPPVAKAPELPPPATKKIILRAVHFDFDKSNIRPDAQPILDEAVQMLDAETGVSIVAEGHTDSIGTSEYNLRLSHRRAEAVRQYLVKHGVNARRIRTEGFGESKPVAENRTPDGRAQNRRVELRILP